MIRVRPAPTVAFLCACLVACGPEAEFDPTDQSSSEVIGGQTTRAQPQVGKYVNSGGGYCTATLITPQWFVTAAHCVPTWDYDDGGRFEITRTVNGKAKIYRYAIDRAYALGEDLRDYDVAVGRLVASVPASIATPSRISSSHPVSGEPVAMFGYGGVNGQNDPSTAGIKRYANLNWGSDPDNLSKGDSGGPHLRGSLTWGLMLANGSVISRPEVVAVNSGFRNSPFRRHDYDFYGYPSRMKHLIEELIRDVDGLEFGVDRFGMDYRHIDYNTSQYSSLSAALSCRQACYQDSRCRSFSLVKSSGRCFLKNATARATPNDNVISGVSGGFEPNVDRPGGDYRSHNLSPPSVNKCATLCAQDWQCRSWTYVPPSNGSSTAKCWLKNRISEPRRSTLSGGGTVITSGLRMGYHYNKHNLGRTYRSFTLGNQPFPDVCQAQCEKEGQCVAWSFSPLRSTNNNAVCYLKSSHGSMFTSVQTVSGYKGHAFKR